jgi:hypothetical protein
MCPVSGSRPNRRAVDWASGAYADFRDLLARWRENAIRLAVVLQIATDPDSQAISAEVARNAVELFEWIGLGSIELLSGGRAQNLNERRAQLEKALRMHDGECLSSELQKRHGVDPTEQKQLAAVFPDVFLIEERAPTQAGGRPGKMVKLITPRHQPPNP